MQAVIRSGGRDTNFLITADSISENWQEIVNITRDHGNDERLSWDLLKIPHHCSYLSMNTEIGKGKTVPTDEFAWLLEQGGDRGAIVSTSRVIPAVSDAQPPHAETYETYKDSSKKINGQIYVTMSYPTGASPGRLKFDVSGAGLVKPQKVSAAVVSSVVTSHAPRNG
jgi:hypothetical protein